MILGRFLFLQSTHRSDFQADDVADGYSPAFKQGGRSPGDLADRYARPYSSSGQSPSEQQKIQRRISSRMGLQEEVVGTREIGHSSSKGFSQKLQESVKSPSKTMSTSQQLSMPANVHCFEDPQTSEASESDYYSYPEGGLLNRRKTS